MTEGSEKKRMPFRPVRPKRPKREDSPRSGRGRPARGGERREGGAAESRPRPAKTEKGDGTRITGLIVSELARAYAVILKLDGPADQLMKAFFKSNPMLGSRDRTILAEAIFYGLRHLASIRWRMQPVEPQRAPKTAALLTLALQYGAGSIADDTYGREKKPVTNMLGADLALAPECVRAESPLWLYGRIRNQYGDEAEAIFEACNVPAPLDARVNILKAARKDVLAELAEHHVAAHEMKFSPDGIRFESKPGLIRWPVYQEGRIEVQDEGSQLIARLLAPRRGEMVCDFCAGAGGKTLAIGALMRSSGRLYAFDVNAARLEGMRPRLRRSGLSNVQTVAIRDEFDNRVKRLRGKFNRVLVDAPCSGTGTLRRNPDLKWRVNEEELRRINALQRSILAEASRLVREGGRLVYATCSMLEEENQAVVREFLEGHPEFELLSATEILKKQGAELPEWQAERFGDWFVMLPHLHGTDGFFAAVLERKAAPRPERAAAEA